MNLVRFKSGTENPKAGLLEAEIVYELEGNVFGPYNKTGKEFAAGDVEILAPCLPGKIIGVGLNYRDHAEEMNFPLPQEPLIFMKAPSTIIGPGQAIVCPKVSKQVDYEAEIAVVMGRRAKNVSSEKALEYVLGYTCLNDVTARDLQAVDNQWVRAKSFDTFCPLGPAIVTDIDPSDLAVEAWLSGERKQCSRTSNLVFDIPALVEYISSIMTLEPGDVIATGTPSGVGPMKPGDSIEIKIEGLGSIVNPVAAE